MVILSPCTKLYIWHSLYYYNNLLHTWSTTYEINRISTCSKVINPFFSNYIGYQSKLQSTIKLLCYTKRFDHPLRTILCSITYLWSYSAAMDWYQNVIQLPPSTCSMWTAHPRRASKKRFSDHLKAILKKCHISFYKLELEVLAMDKLCGEMPVRLVFQHTSATPRRNPSLCLLQHWHLPTVSDDNLVPTPTASYAAWLCCIYFQLLANILKFLLYSQFPG